MEGRLCADGRHTIALPIQHRIAASARGQGHPVATGIPLIDFCNAHSLRIRAPVGAYDLARLPPEPMQLRPCRPDSDRFHPLGAPAYRYPLLPRLILYASGEKILCWGLNHRDSQRTALTATSHDVAIFSEAAFASQHAACTAVIAAVREQLQQAGGDCSPHLVAHAEAPGFDL